MGQRHPALGLMMYTHDTPPTMMIQQWYQDAILDDAWGEHLDICTRQWTPHAPILRYVGDIRTRWTSIQHRMTVSMPAAPGAYAPHPCHAQWMERTIHHQRMGRVILRSSQDDTILFDACNPDIPLPHTPQGAATTLSHIWADAWNRHTSVYLHAIQYALRTHLERSMPGIQPQPALYIPSAHSIITRSQPHPLAPSIGDAWSSIIPDALHLWHPYGPRPWRHATTAITIPITVPAPHTGMHMVHAMHAAMNTPE